MPTSLGLPPGSLTGVWSDETYAWIKKYLRTARDPRGGFFGLDQHHVLVEAFGLFHASNTSNPYRHGETKWKWRDVTPYLPSAGSIQRLARDAIGSGAERDRKLPNLDQGQSLVSFLTELRAPKWKNSMKYTAEALLNIHDWGTEWNEQIFDLDIYDQVDRDSIVALFANPTMPQRLRQAAIDSHAYGAENPAMDRLHDWSKEESGFGNRVQQPAMAGLIRNPSTTHEEIQSLIDLIKDAVEQTRENFAAVRPVRNYQSNMREILRDAEARLLTSPLKNHHGYGVDCQGTCLCNSEWQKAVRPDPKTEEEAFNSRFEFITYEYRKINGTGFDEALVFNTFYCQNYADAYAIQAFAAGKMVDYFTGDTWLPSPSSLPWTVIPALTYYERLREAQESLGGSEVPLEWTSLLLA